MMVAVLRWIFGSAEAATTTEQNDPVFQDARHFGGCQYRLRTHCPVAASIRSVDAAWIIQEQLSAAMDARPHSINTIPSRSNRRVEIRIRRDRHRQDDRKPPSSLGSGLIGRDEPICNLV